MSSVAGLVMEFQLSAPDATDLAVRRVRGWEALSRPYVVEVEFWPLDRQELSLSDLLGQPAAVSLQRPGGEPRYFNGLIEALRLTGYRDRTPRYLARLVPKLDRLRHRVRSRVFQKINVPEMVKDLLDDAEIEQDWGGVTGDYPEREYCVQYRESDLVFVSRLLEDCGIAYAFEQTRDGHKVLFFDGPPPGPGPLPLPFRRGVPENGFQASSDDHLFQLSRLDRLTTSKVSLKDFDYQRPGLAVFGSQEADSPSVPLERYEYPGGFVDPGLGEALARVRLEEQTADSPTFDGQGSAIGLSPGGTFEVQEHPEEAFNRTLLVREIEHQAEQAEGLSEGAAIVHYRNRWVGLAAERPFRPSRRAAKPRALPTTGTVVGSSGEELAPEGPASVKVQFHWDREGAGDDTASCWIRCAQAWGGGGLGAVFLPRIGQEVLVKFLDGDPDKPLVTGATYNGDHPPPLTLPDDKTKSTLKSDTTPGGGGANELRFEDLLMAEELYLHAQRDQLIAVERDKAQTVGGREALQVAKDRSLEVDGFQSLQVERDELSAIGGNQTLSVTGNRSTVTLGSAAETVAVVQTLTVAAARELSIANAVTQTVGGAAALTVAGSSAVTSQGALDLSVVGDRDRSVGGDHLTVAGPSLREVVGGAATDSLAGDRAAQVEGSAAQSTGKDRQDSVDGKVGIAVTESVSWRSKEFSLQADSFQLMVGGTLVLGIDNSGNVSLGPAALTIDGSQLVFKGGSIKKVAAGSASSGSLSVAQLKAKKGDQASFSIAIKDALGNPVINERFQAKFADGTVRKGRTDGSGRAVVSGPKTGTVKLKLASSITKKA